MSPAERIIRTLDRHLEGPARIRLMGGAAMILGYAFTRATEDVDLLADDREIEALIEEANLGAALERTNAELAPEGLYLSHIWGPEQQILTPEWRSSCRSLVLALDRLQLEVLGPLDMILSKACRADDGDLGDIRHLIAHEQLPREIVARAFDRAEVPEVFQEVLPANRDRILGLFPG